MSAVSRRLRGSRLVRLDAIDQSTSVTLVLRSGMMSAANSRRRCWQRPALGLCRLLSQSRPGAPPHLRRLPPLAARAHLYLPLDSSLPPSSSSRLSTLAITTRPATRTVPVLVPALPSCRRSLHLRASSPALSPTDLPAAAATTTIMGEPKWSAAAVRTTFLEFFQERGHTVAHHLGRF